VKNENNTWFSEIKWCLLVCCFFFTLCSSYALGNKDITQSEIIKSTKKNFKDFKRAKSLKTIFYHNDSVKLVNKFIHQQHELVKGKGKKIYPYKSEYDKSSLKNIAYNASTKYKLEYEVFGWYPYWEQDLYKSLNYSLLTTVAYFSYDIDPETGNPKTVQDWDSEPLLDSIKTNGVRFLLTITCFGNSDNQMFLKNDLAIKNLIAQLKSLLQKTGANGVCVDFEGISSSQKSDYGKFIGLLGKELRKSDSECLIYITVPSVDWQASLDFDVLIPVVDVFVIMGYDYYGSDSDVAGPTAPSESGEIWEPFNLTNSIDYYLNNGVPADKLIMALPYYGVIWDTHTGEKGAKVKDFIGYRDYSYLKENLENKIESVMYDSVSQTAWCSYVLDNEGSYFRQCWFDNDSTISAKINLIKYKNLKGMGIWALGYDRGYNDLWKVIAEKLTNKDVLYNNCYKKGIAGKDVVNLTADSDTAVIKTKLNIIENLLQEVTDYKTILLFIMAFVVLFGGLGFVIALFYPDTRGLFFSKMAYKIYYVSLVLLSLVVILRWTDVINDLSIALILGFIMGAVAIWFINKIIEKLNKNMP